ncbi:MAG: EamA family transporter [Nanoarchaeota archaeon]
MLWLFFALLEPVLHAFSNVLDNYLSNKMFKNVATLVFYSTITNVMFLPLVFLFKVPSMISISQVPFFIILGFTGISYLYPYYKSLQNDDTSVVVSLFDLGRIFVPILAFFLVGEVLSVKQYVGFLIIILAGAFLTFNIKNFHFNKSFYWMMLCSFIIAIDVVIYKYIFNMVDWSTGFFWATVFSFLFSIPLLFFPKIRFDIKKSYNKFKNGFKLFALEEFITFAGQASLTFAVSLKSVTLVSAISSFQPIFVLFYGFILGKYFPGMFKEKSSLFDILKKLFLFIIMIFGVILILN